MIRRLAVAILACAIRHAEPHQREWGKAILREMDFVQSDWDALRWAVGGAGAIFRGLGSSKRSPAGANGELTGIGRKIHRVIRVTRSLNLIEGLIFAVLAFTSQNVPQRIGSGLIVASVVLFFFLQLCIRRSDLSNLESCAPVELEIRRSKLEREYRDFVGVHLAAQVAAFMPGAMAFIIGIQLAHPETETDPLWTAASLALSPLLFLQSVLPGLIFGPSCRGCNWRVADGGHHQTRHT